MTQAVTARRDGDTFQARLFWLHAARLLDNGSPIAKVGFETGPRSFDDIWVEYDEGSGPSDHSGQPLRRVHMQAKWHSTPNSFGYSELTDPGFINANALSYLQRARNAQKLLKPDGGRIQFKLVTNWRIERSDPLRQMVNTRSGALRLDRLHASKTDNSRDGAVRKAWREHLGIEDKELQCLAGSLAFGEATDSLTDLRDRLDTLFGAVGLRRVPSNESAFFYDDLVYQWMGQNRLEFDRMSFTRACDREGILVTSTPEASTLGVKSFEHAFDRLEDHCEEVLNLVPEFDQRYIRSDSDWSKELHPKLKRFLVAAASSHDRLRLALDVHATLAFAAGAILDIKCGRTVELEQRTLSKSIWAPDDLPPDPAWPEFCFAVTEVDSSRPEMAIAVGITHDIARDVLAFIERSVPTVGKLLVCSPSSGAGARKVVCGRHAFDLAECMAQKVVELRSPGSEALNHLFIAAPNTFTFLAGQRNAVMGPTRLYEFDFERQRHRTYRASLTLPIRDPPNGAKLRYCSRSKGH